MLIRFLLLTLGFSLLASGQAKRDPYRYVRFLAVGNEPRFVPKLVNKVIVMQPSRPGEAPPRLVSAKSEVPQINPLEIHRSKFSRFVAFGPKVDRIELTEGETSGGKKWYAAAVPKLQRSLAVLYRDHKTLNWFTTKSLILKDDATTFPLGSARWVNVSDRMVKLTFITQKKGQRPKKRELGLPSGKSLVMKIGADGTTLKVEVPVRGKEPVFVSSQRIQVDKDRRHNVIFYKDGKPGSQKPLVFDESEKLPALPKLPKLEEK